MRFSSTPGGPNHLSSRKRYKVVSPPQAGCGGVSAPGATFDWRRKILISTGLQPGDDGRKISESRFNGFDVRKNPLKRVLF
jgi:hypothetical protein